MQRLIVLLALLAVSLARNLYYGVPQQEGKIVGGKPVPISSYPYQLSLEVNGKHDCGASIISSTKALTAAHCLVGQHPSKLTVRAGSSDREKGGQVVKVQSVTLHPSYNRQTQDYDIAILHLAESVTKGSVIPLLGQGQEVSVGTRTTVTGWGKTSENGQLAKQLQAVDINVVSDESCKKVYSNLTPRMICAGVAEGGKSPCQADSGGPLVANGRQIGVVSFAAGCGRPRTPAVFAKVSNLRNWIKQTAGV